ncbi:MAG: hypothetical protein RBS28_12375 [Rhodocyclaceae bacterium]|jgi:hypothetical protein|nr:hypothetical protein [Rhodocyclaceae bacterium]
MSEENDGRLSFKEAVALVMQRRQAAFSAMPVFGDRSDDEEQTAEGARIFILESDGEGDWQMRFIAGPFFSNAYAANEVLAPDEVPDSVRELRFMPTRTEPGWFDEQIQILIQKLVQGSGIEAQMPDYESMPSRSAEENVVFPVNFIGRDGAAKPH